MRGAGVVVLDVPAHGVRAELVPEPLEQLAELLLGEQEEEHDRVGLLGQLVAVRVVALGPQDPVQSLDPAVVPLAVPVPVELRELLVSLELADDAVAVERHEHLAAHLRPCGDLVVGELDPAPQRLGAARREEAEDRRGGGADPGDHDVGVGVVAQPALRRPRVLLVELVGSHHPVDLVAVARGVVVRERGPEAGDLEHHLRPVVEHELDVAGRPVVVPDVVEDRRVHVALVVAEVRLPAPGERVEVHDLGLLLAVAAALPRVHRAAVAGRPRRSARLPQPARPVLEQVPADPRQAEVEEREHVQLVPEHVAAVRLAVQAARDDAGVLVGRVARADLQDVGDVKAQQQLHARVPGQDQVARLPELVPRRAMLGQRPAERRVVADGLSGVAERLADRAVVRCVERDHLLDAHRRALRHVEGEDRLDVVLHLMERCAAHRPAHRPRRRACGPPAPRGSATGACAPSARSPRARASAGTRAPGAGPRAPGSARRHGS